MQSEACRDDEDRQGAGAKLLEELSANGRWHRTEDQCQASRQATTQIQHLCIGGATRAESVFRLFSQSEG